MKIRHKKFTASIIGVGLSALAGTAQAVDLHGMAKVGLDFGGDTVYTALFTDGSTRTIKANQGFYIGGGVALVEVAKNIDTEFTLAWKFTSITASNGDITFTRFPLEALVFYKFEKVRLGGGLAYHISPKLSGSGVASGVNTSYDNALGGILQADYRITDKMNVGLRYTSVDYKVGGATAKGNGAGITFSSSF